MKPSPKAIKTELREQAISARLGLDDEERAEMDDQICRHLLDHIKSQPPQRIAAYLAFRGEPDLVPAIERLDRQSHHVFLPVIDGDRMEFRQWKTDADFQPNRFGILEPTQGLICKPEDLDMVLLPLVSYDTSGNRLGMGGGYYDRCFAFRQSNPKTQRPKLIGTAYGVQQIGIGLIPDEPWDIKMDGVVTEQGWQRFD